MSRRVSTAPPGYMSANPLSPVLLTALRIVCFVDRILGRANDLRRGLAPLKTALGPCVRLGLGLKLVSGADHKGQGNAVLGQHVLDRLPAPAPAQVNDPLGLCRLLEILARFERVRARSQHPRDLAAPLQDDRVPRTHDQRPRPAQFAQNPLWRLRRASLPFSTRKTACAVPKVRAATKRRASALDMPCVSETLISHSVLAQNTRNQNRAGSASPATIPLRTARANLHRDRPPSLSARTGREARR